LIGKSRTSTKPQPEFPSAEGEFNTAALGSPDTVSGNAVGVGVKVGVGVYVGVGVDVGKGVEVAVGVSV
jgi:hypothetical protein